MKKTISTLLAVIMVLSVLFVVPFSASAQETQTAQTAVESEGYLYELLPDGTAEITESKISVYFVAAVFTYDHIAESGDFGLEVCDVSLDHPGAVEGAGLEGAVCGDSQSFHLSTGEHGIQFQCIAGDLGHGHIGPQQRQDLMQQ